MADGLNERVDRIEELVLKLAERQTQLDDVLVTLADAQIKTQEQLRELVRQNGENARQIAENTRGIAENALAIKELREAHAQEARDSRERDRVLDERVDRLVSAIGEFIRQSGERRN